METYIVVRLAEARNAGEARVEFKIENTSNRQISYHWKIIKSGEDDNLYI